MRPDPLRFRTNRWHFCVGVGLTHPRQPDLHNAVRMVRPTPDDLRAARQRLRDWVGDVDRARADQGEVVCCGPGVMDEATYRALVKAQRAKYGRR